MVYNTFIIMCKQHFFLLLSSAYKQRGLCGARGDRRRCASGLRIEAAARGRIPSKVRGAIRMCTVHGLPRQVC